VTGYEDLIESLQLPDADDRHVLAAAIRARGGVIVTANLRDFPASIVDYSIWSGCGAEWPQAARDHRQSLPGLRQ
jgi:hypothetical protein